MPRNVTIVKYGEYQGFVEMDRNVNYDKLSKTYTQYMINDNLKNKDRRINTLGYFKD